MDLAEIICHPLAAVPIKSYSPDLIVHPLLSDSLDDVAFLQRIDCLMRKNQVVVIGPGLSLDQTAQNMAFKIAKVAKAHRLTIILDGVKSLAALVAP